MSYKNVVLFIEAGHVPPQETVEKIMEEHKSLIGFAAALTIEEDGTETQVLELETASGDDFPSIAEVMTQLEAYKDDKVLLVLGDYPKEFEDESEQPYIILRAEPTDEDSVPILVACIDIGESAHGADGADASAVVADILRGTLGRFLSTASDMNNLVELIQTDPAIPRMIKGLYKDRASITLLAENGAVWTWGENAAREETPWGWMSQGEKKSITEQVKGAVTKTVRSFGGGRKGAAADKTDTSARALPAASQEQTAVHQTTAKGAAGGDAAYIMVAPPEEWNKDQKRTFYKQLNNGHVPNGYKDGPQIKILRSVWDAWEKANAGKVKPIANVEPVEPTPVSKVEVIPKAPATELKLHKDVFMKRPTVVKIVNEGRGIIDPKRQQETEKEYATYTELSGLKDIKDVFAYSNEDILDLITKTPTIAMILMGNLIGYAIEHTPEEELNPEVEETPVVKATGTDNRSASQQARVAPKKASGPRTFGVKK